MKHVVVLGEGAWGTACAQLLAENGMHVRLWCYHAEIAQEIKQHRTNSRYMPGFKLHAQIEPTHDIEQAVCGADFVFEAIPVQYLRSVMEQTVSCFKSTQTWVALSKGIEQQTLMVPTHLIDDVFGYETKKAVIAGPSFAHDLMKHEITGVTLAASDCDSAHHLQSLLANSYFRPYISLDLMGVQVGAAVKNVITLGVGLLKGAGYSDNAQALLLTRGLHEIVQIAVALGGKQETVYGLSGMGDLVLTAMGSQSKNLLVGTRLGKGQSLQTILQETGFIPEGINTVQAVHQLMKRHNLDLPICAGIYHVIFEQQSVTQFLTNLMEKPLEFECSF